MAKIDTNVPKLTRGDKAHKKLMDKLDTLKDGMTHGLDSFTLIHKQTLNAFSNNYEKVSESQEFERRKLYEIIEKSEDETERKEAFTRLATLDQIKDKDVNDLNDRTQSEGDKANKNIAASVVCLMGACGFIVTNKQVRQALTTMGKNLLQIKARY